MHQEVILQLLDKIGCTLDDLLTGCPYSIRPAYYEEQLREHIELKPYNSDCSGKHCGFLADCIACGYPLADYNKPDHPLQKDVLKVVSEVSGYPAEKIAIGVDGCGVPVHGMPLTSFARAFAAFTTPENLPEKYQKGAEILAEAMNAEPDMLAGPGGFCSEFLRATHGRFIGKLGAEAIYCVGVRGKNLGIAVKVEDGNLMRPLNPAVMSVLDQLGLLSDEEKESLKQFIEPVIYNVHNWEVGVVRPAFKLHFTGREF
jgi:L-asparaginase II